MRIDYSEWWAEMVALARANSSILLAIAGAFLFLPSLAGSFFMQPMEPLAQGATPAEAFARLTEFVGANAAPQLVLLLFSTLGQALLYAVLLDRSRPSVGDAFPLALRLFLPLLLVNIVVNLLVGAGLFLLVVPGLYLLGRTLLSAPALVAERRGNPFAAIGRSFALTAGQGWRIVFFALLIFVVAYVVNIAVGGTLGIAIGLLPGADDQTSVRNLLLAALNALFSSAIFLLAILINVALYRRLTTDVADTFS